MQVVSLGSLDEDEVEMNELIEEGQEIPELTEEEMPEELPEELPEVTMTEEEFFFFQSTALEEYNARSRSMK